MNLKNLGPQIFLAAAALLLLGMLGAYWPDWVKAGASQIPQQVQATIGDAILYQGFLTDENDVPLTGTYAMTFSIYNDQNGGTLLWDSGNMGVMVNEGLFEARLAISTDIFNGEELWVVQTIDGELLEPRQEILPAPMAHTLRPGAIIKGTANAVPNNYLFEVDMNNDEFAFNQGAMAGRTTTGNAIYGLANNGRAIYGQTQDGYAVYGFDGGSNANQGYGGYFYSTNGIGVYGYSNGNRAHPNILAPGVYGQSNRGVGVYGRGDTSDSYSFYNEGGFFEGGRGLYARGTDPAVELGYGARIYSDNYRGLYVRGGTNYFDAYFGGTGGISSNSYVDRVANSQSLVVNLGEAAIEPGDLVAMVGVDSSPENGEPMLGVAKLDDQNRDAVIGVAKEGAVAEIVTFEDGDEMVNFAAAEGEIAPGGFLVIITEGLAPAVNVSHLALIAEGTIGDKISLPVSDQMGRSISESDLIVVGKLAGPIDEETGTVPLFINID